VFLKICLIKKTWELEDKSNQGINYLNVYQFISKVMYPYSVPQVNSRHCVIKTGSPMAGCGARMH